MKEHNKKNALNNNVRDVINSDDWTKLPRETKSIKFLIYPHKEKYLITMKQC